MIPLKLIVMFFVALSSMIFADKATKVTPSISPTPTAEPTIPKTLISPTIYVQQNNPQNNENSKKSDWVYPGAQIESQNSTSVTLKSADNTKTITDWYKDKIEQHDMNATSVVQTSTNDNVLNKIVAGKNGENISVEIKKSASESIVSIFVTLTIDNEKSL